MNKVAEIVMWDVVFTLLGMCIGGYVENHRMRREAVEVGAAQWVIINAGGGIKFEWKTLQKEH